MVMTLKHSTLNSVISTFAFLIGIHHYHHLRLLPGLTMRPSKVQVKSTFNPVLLPDSLKNSTNQHFALLANKFNMPFSLARLENNGLHRTVHWELFSNIRFVCSKTFTCKSNVSSHQFSQKPKKLLKFKYSMQTFSFSQNVKIISTCAFVGLRTGFGSQEVQSKRARSCFTLEVRLEMMMIPLNGEHTTNLTIWLLLMLVK